MNNLQWEVRLLNEMYGRLEEEYNTLRSNWEWFVAGNSPVDPLYRILARVEQN